MTLTPRELLATTPGVTAALVLTGDRWQWIGPDPTAPTAANELRRIADRLDQKGQAK